MSVYVFVMLIFNGLVPDISPIQHKPIEVIGEFESLDDCKNSQPVVQKSQQRPGEFYYSICVKLDRNFEEEGTAR